MLHHFNKLKMSNNNLYVFSIFPITSLSHPTSYCYSENHSPCLILVKIHYLLSELHLQLLSRLQFLPIAFFYIKISLICLSVYIFFPTCAPMCIFCQPCKFLALQLTLHLVEVTAVNSCLNFLLQ